MSNSQGKHEKSSSNQETPRRTRYRGDYAYAQRQQPKSEREAPVYTPPKVSPTPSNDVSGLPTSDEGESKRSLLPVIIAIVLILLAAAVLYGATQGWFNGTRETMPDVTKEPVVEPTPQVVYVFVTPEATEVPTAAPTEVPTEAPTEVPTEEPTEVPTEAPTMGPTEVSEVEPEVPDVHAEYAETGATITFTIDKEKVIMSTFTYAGGYIPYDDPWYAELAKEAEGSYGPSLEGETIEEGVYNWLHELPKSPLQIIRARVQMGVEKLDSLQAETAKAWEIARLSQAEYDEIANDTLTRLFRVLKWGKVVVSTDWELENFMREVEDEESGYPLEVRGRLNSDDDKILEEKDVLITIVDKTGKNYISAPRGLANTANDAHVSVKEFDVRAWVNLTEGGTWKWKRGGGGKPTPVPTDPPTPPPTDPPTPPPTDPPTNPPTTTPPPDVTPTPAPPTDPPTPPPTDPPTPPPTDPPTPPPTDPPTPPPTDPPTPTPRPTKNPDDRPTITDAPIGGGPTNPENSEDPHTTDAPPTSTPYNPTPAPDPTPTPTPVPTAAVGPTEVCDPPAAPPIREDTQPAPEPDPDHNVPEPEPEVADDPNNTDDFDPDSV
ncbi:hypothetical protein IKF74_02360 [Candidatus Saccharibacteria bacterium]|nr:hypothetical protein [Candidatus Saccharibacteria bacterium]